MKKNCNELENLYLELLKKTLTDLLNEGRNHFTPLSPNSKNPLKRIALNFIINKFESKNIRVVYDAPIKTKERENGIGWPVNGYTMIGVKRLENIEFCIKDVVENNVEGDFIETGVWKGGACIFAQALFKIYNQTNRTVWVADSFEGLPKPDVDKYPEDKGDDLYTIEQLRVSLEDVKNNFEKFNLLDNNVKFLKGWFKDTLPKAPIKKLAVIRLDGDMYESTMDGIKNLYPKLSKGGYIIIDDYGAIEACRKAIHDYRKEHNIHDEIIPIDWSGVYWKKS